MTQLTPEQIFDTECTDEPICPWCGHEQGDSGEYNKDESGTDRCSECHKGFLYERQVSISFTTTKPEEPANA